MNVGRHVATLCRPSSSANLRSASQSCGLAGTGRLRSASTTAGWPTAASFWYRRSGGDRASPDVASAERIAQVEQHRRLPQAVIRERTLAGLKAARARGRKGGRKFALLKAQVRLAQAAMAHRDTSVAELCSELGIRPVTLYRYVGPKGQLREQGEKVLAT